MSEKSQTIGDFTASRLSPINIPDRLGWTETNLENRERFYASQISAMVGDHSRQMKICIVGDVGDGFRSLPIPQIVGLQSPHHASFNFWRTFQRESERELWRLSDISGTVGKKWKPRSSGIFPTYENQQLAKATLHVQHTFFCTFLCRCFAQLQRETSRNFLVTRFMEEMSYVIPFTFFHCRSFSTCIGGR